MLKSKKHTYKTARQVSISAILLILILLPPSILFAQESLTLSLDRSDATLLDTIRLTVNLSGVSSVNSRPSLGGLQAFDIQQGGTSSRTEIINGRRSSHLEFSYNLIPTKTGTFQVGPAELNHEGRVLRSNVATITIKETKRSEGDERGPLFLSATLSSKEVYVEEQIIYSLKLYMQTDVSDISLSLPEMENLVFKQLGKESVYQSVYNGQQYRVLEVRYVLTPSKDGVYGIRSARMSMMAAGSQGSSRSPFDQFFSRSYGVQKNLASEPLELTVLPLPEKSRPTDFSGLVGTFEFESRLEPMEIKAGESATLTVKIKGRGNIKQIPDLKFFEQENTKVYADQPVLNESMDSKGITGAKVMKWAIVPEKEGIYQLSPLSVSFFDTSTRQYRSIQTTPYALAVKPGQEDELQTFQAPKDGNGSGGLLKQEVKQLGQDILPIHSSLKGMRKVTGTGGDFTWWIILAAPLLIYVAFFWVVKFNRVTATSMAVQKAKKAAKVLMNQCKGKDISYNDTVSTLMDYLNDRFNLSLGTLTAEESVGFLVSKGVQPETAGKIKKAIKEMEDAVYTGKGENACSLAEEIPGLIQAIEKEIR